MEVKGEQMYLGDIISADGRHFKNVQARKNKSLGTINQIMQMYFLENSTLKVPWFFDPAYCFLPSFRTQRLESETEKLEQLMRYNYQKF